MRSRRAIFAGIVGCIVVVTIVAAAERLSGSGADICSMSGALVIGRTDALGWVVGFVVQSVIAVIAAFVYGAIFEWVTRHAGAIIGLAIAIPHVIIAGLGVGFIPADPLLARNLAPPGAFLEYEGSWAVLAFVCAHLLFGVVVGSLYGKTRHTIPTSRVRLQRVEEQVQ
jgi:hypothetical protein